jgi:hypothetical protein
MLLPALWDGDLIAEPIGTCPVFGFIGGSDRSRLINGQGEILKTGGGVMFGSEEDLAFIRRFCRCGWDAADAAGSLHSKIKKLSDDALATLAKAPWMVNQLQ